MKNMINDIKDAAILYATCWNQIIFADWFENLSDDCTYSSQYVFESLNGREKIIEYLSGKIDTIKKSGHRVKAKLATLKHGASLNPPPGTPCVAMYQGDSEDISAIVFFEVKNGKIFKYDLCMPELYTVEVSS